MTKSAELEGFNAMASAERERFDLTSIVLHWLTVLLIAAMFTSIWLLETLDQESYLAAALLTTHQTMGVLTWTVGVMRLLWRRNFAYLPPFPQSMRKFQQAIAKANEYGLYLLLLVQPVTGLGRVLLRGKPFDLFFWEIPALFEPDPAIRSLLVEAHEWGARALVVLIGLHAGAALFHRLVLRDGVLQRMLPRLPDPIRRGQSLQGLTRNKISSSVASKSGAVVSQTK